MCDFSIIAINIPELMLCFKKSRTSTFPLVMFRVMFMKQKFGLKISNTYKIVKNTVPSNIGPTKNNGNSTLKPSY